MGFCSDNGERIIEGTARNAVTAPLFLFLTFSFPWHIFSTRADLRIMELCSIWLATVQNSTRVTLTNGPRCIFLPSARRRRRHVGIRALVFEYSIGDFFWAQTEVGVERVVADWCWLGSPCVWVLNAWFWVSIFHVLFCGCLRFLRDARLILIVVSRFWSFFDGW